MHKYTSLSFSLALVRKVSLEGILPYVGEGEVRLPGWAATVSIFYLTLETDSSKRLCYPQNFQKLYDVQ